jgi:cathepsin D
MYTAEMAPLTLKPSNCNLLVPLRMSSPFLTPFELSLTCDIYSKFLQGFDNYERNTGQRHPLSPDIKDFKRNLAHEPLSDEGILWTGTVSVGSPPADFAVDIDTGSSDLFIPSQSCDSTCSGDNIYNPSASHTSTDTGKSFNLTYGSGFAAVEEFTDTITIAGLTVATQSIGAATHLSSGFQPSNFPADGIMGMAFQSLSAFNAPPVFQSLVAAGQTDSSLFALSLTSAGGELTLGGLNQDLYIGGVDYLPVDGNGYWKVTFDSLAINVKEVIGNVPCVIDSVRGHYYLLTPVE